MEPAFSNNIHQLPVYKKALDIYKISRALASYFTHDKHVIEMSISSDLSHRTAGNLVTDSLQLIPGIASAFCVESSQIKLSRIKYIRKLAKQLRKRCKRLEFTGIKEIEFLNLLRSEINHFERLTTDWSQQVENAK